MRRIAILLAGAMVLSIIAFAGPASAAKIKSCKKDKQVAEHIQDAFNVYLTSDTSEAKMEFVQDGEKIIPISEEGSAAAAAAGQTSSDTTTYAVDFKVTCDGKKAATYKYDLAVGIPKPVTNPPSTGIGLDFAGDAVLVKGKWLITGATICDLIGQNPNTPGLGDKCLEAIL